MLGSMLLSQVPVIESPCWVGRKSMHQRARQGLFLGGSSHLVGAKNQTQSRMAPVHPGVCLWATLRPSPCRVTSVEPTEAPGPLGPHLPVQPAFSFSSPFRAGQTAAVPPAHLSCV